MGKAGNWTTLQTDRPAGSATGAAGAAIDTSVMFRLPWTMPDNAMTWMEPTQQCNITCDACFVANNPGSHKSLDEIRQELLTLNRLRKCDAMLIAGGEPLVHPDIVDIVRMVKSFKLKPVLITNGVDLDRRLAKELKRAGAFGFTFHIDSHQSRPGWEGKTESELNELRQHYADLLYDLGGLSCAFNTTVFEDTLGAIPDIVRWAVRQSNKVHIMTLICVRMGEVNSEFTYYAGGKQINLSAMPYITKSDYRKLTTDDIVAEVKTVLTEFTLCAYLGGTVVPRSLKWAIGTHLIAGGESIGYLGSRSMELIQNGSHFFRGLYLAYSKPATVKRGRTTLMLAMIDPEVRKALRRYVKLILRKPLALFRRVNVQSITIVQPTDILDNGEQDNCDGCPNKTLWHGELVSACRIEEYRNYGGEIRTIPSSSGKGRTDGSDAADT
ncbi:MAG: radical SAM protein [Candidatus Zixiibacteriota bacterium]